MQQAAPPVQRVDAWQMREKCATKLSPANNGRRREKLSKCGIGKAEGEACRNFSFSQAFFFSGCCRWLVLISAKVRPGLSTSR